MYHEPLTLRRHALPLILLGAIAGIVLSGNAPRLMALLASTTSSLYTTPATIFFSAEKTTDLTVGVSHTVDINVNTRTPINTVGATVRYPTEYVDVVGISKEKSFLDLWTEETAIREDVGEMHFSGGTYRPGGLMGTGTVLTLTLRAKKPGDAVVSFKETALYPSDGSGIALETTHRTLSLSITPAPSAAGGTAATPLPLASAAPDPDFNSDGIVSVVDVSILAFKILGAYDARYDLDRNGALGLSDLSVLFTYKR